METIQGKNTCRLDALELERRLADYQRVLLDLGTGDGRFVLQAAHRDSGLFAIGVDACRENLREESRAAPGNVLFIIANALDLPAELRQLTARRAVRVTINFPWGSLLNGLLSPDPALLSSLYVLASTADLEVCLNASALGESGWTLEEGGQRVHQVLSGEGFHLRPPQRLDAAALRHLPSTWAKRMAYGRKPEAVLVKTV